MLLAWAVRLNKIPSKVRYGSDAALFRKERQEYSQKADG